ncbi:uncharacterized protein LACBIDRAFT_294545 [Laccaria bicolor S238N-H82]|uniref:Predicted protein n=1 Tax=Laccaria bicolor (strain S238N-H82 / ATCC MYA-4686) TaxID=486041 RepID=B0DDM4_LACBS|nr:uncharacterized protein LACBIDRAFT_294545 [Laccaria bicolor S238N-H82]EDR07239.1 predicted protein [Laccaria bicolor S238N-H82]|eukprot:XP_001882170.1 predicted protein [Laccaria bicolor S238N-H82]
MLFRSIATVISAALFAQSVCAALTPAQVVASVEVVTTLSASITKSVSVITTKSSLNTISSTSKTVSTGFTKIVSTIGTFVTGIEDTSPFPDDAAQLVVNALVAVNLITSIFRRAADVVWSIHSIFAQFALTAPIVAVLRTLEGAIDSLAFALIGLIPTKSNEVSDAQFTLSTSVTDTISIYDQTCFPSLFWPKGKPVCIG